MLLTGSATVGWPVLRGLVLPAVARGAGGAAPVLGEDASVEEVAVAAAAVDGGGEVRDEDSVDGSEDDEDEDEDRRRDCSIWIFVWACIDLVNPTKSVWEGAGTEFPVEGGYGP